MVASGVTRILLISGSTREGSTNTAALRTVHAIAREGVETRFYTGLLELPAFVPGADPASYPAVVGLREALGWADAVLISTPEYAGTLPGSMKNLLDWTVGTADLHEKPTAWLTVAAQGRGDGATATLSSVLGYVGADIVSAACVRRPVLSTEVGTDGLVTARGFRDGALEALDELVRHAERVRDLVASAEDGA
ncbi:NADPH-dependent FMN reductase [Nocardia amikacinitolerans]|uniref:NADPH-dependent FMN reductase n=1 Tax=Nocardia amikacinitolerans TaxID=756689 RepID=UPI0020A45863|nr:NADPH-dependent FMN reductase [Nocardia amikacinitolerans]MCP2290432.1 NAD(P)H-dependent FMN reductase [Nocardia amikacinitolerans]